MADIEQAGIEYGREHTGQRFSDQGLRQLAERVLGPSGTLSERKVFAKRDVIVAVAPRVFGLPAVELEKATDRVLRDPDAIPLLGVPRASERAYATAHVIATERAIEQAVERVWKTWVRPGCRPRWEPHLWTAKPLSWGLY